MVGRLSGVLLAALALPLAAFAYTSPGRPSGYVNDFAGLLSGDERQALEQKLASFDRASGNEIAVVTVANLAGDTIDNYAAELFKEWGIGKKTHDNGVLLLAARDEHAVRIEVGYGLEGALTDAESNAIIQSVIIPAFRQSRYALGLTSAVDQIMAATKGEYAPPARQSLRVSADTIQFFLFAGVWILVWLASVLGRSKSWWAGGVVGGVIGLIIGLVEGFIYVGMAAVILLVPFGLFFDYVVSRAYARGRAAGAIPWWVGGGRGGLGGGGGGFGGFGGGLSGGGGASGRW